MKIDLIHGRICWTAMVAVIILSCTMTQNKLVAADDDGPPRQPPPGGNFFPGPPPGGGQDLRWGEPYREALRLLQAQALSSGETGKYWIGVECREAPPELMTQLGLKEG